MGPLRRVGKYELVELIAEGGMGRLYRARDSNPGGLDRDIALKVIQPDLEDQKTYIEMFTEEARLAGILTHSNLLHVYEFGRDEETLFLAMELVEGHSLSDVLHKSMRAPLVRYVLHIVEQVARGLDYAHRLAVDGKGLALVHRDVSPQNILISFDGAVKLTDFGIASIRRAQPLTQAGELKGKLGYLPPEYLKQQKVSPQLDVFALGVVLWEGLIGGKLFPTADRDHQVERVEKGLIAPPTRLESRIPQPLSDITMRALAADPARRFQSAREFGNAIRDFGLANDMFADEVELAKEMRRLFPKDVPATAMDLRGLTRKILKDPRLYDEPVAPAAEIVYPEDDTPLTSEPSATPSTAPNLTQRLPEALTDPDPAMTPASKSATTTAPDRPRLKAEVPPSSGTPPPQKTLPEDLPTPVSAPAPHRRRGAWGALAGAALLLTGGLGWWQQRSAAVPAPTPPAAATPPPSVTSAAAAMPTPTATATPIETPSVRPEPPTVRPERSRGANPIPPAATHPAHASHSRAAAPPHPLKPGTLAVIAVHPWVQVFVDGVSRGYSPAPSISVPAGRHKITLSNDEVHITRTFSIEVPESGRVVFRGEATTLEPSTTDQPAPSPFAP